MSRYDRSMLLLVLLFFVLFPSVSAAESMLPGVELLNIDGMATKELLITAGISMIGMLIFANFCCKNAEKVSAKLGSAIGLAVLAISSSIPLLAVAITSALAGSPELAISNVVATNIANLSLVLGSLAVLKPIETRRGFIKGLLALLVLLFGAAAILNNISIYDNGFSPIFETASENIITGQEALLLIMSFLVFIFLLNFVESSSESSSHGSLTISSAMTIAYGIAVCYCANAAVHSLILLAKHYALPEAVIGATIVVIGTSFPEFSIALASMISKKDNLIYANLVTSSAVNFALGVGIASLLTTMAIGPMITSFFFPVMIIGHAATLAFVLNGKLTRIHGIMLVGLYVLYVYLLSTGIVYIFP